MNKKKDIFKLKTEHPTLMEKALIIERQAKLNGSVVGLGRGYKWSELLDEQERISKMATLFDEEMPCGCYDGD
jgi:hypothetical protein